MGEFESRVMIAIWVVFVLTIAAFYAKSRLDVRRRWHPWIAVVGAFVLFGFVLATSPMSVYVAAPLCAVLTWVNYKITKFCAGCGATLLQNPPWTPINFCSQCGERMAPPQPLQNG